MHLQLNRNKIYYINIYQEIKCLSLDVAEFIEQGPEMAELPCV